MEGLALAGMIVVVSVLVGLAIRLARKKNVDLIAIHALSFRTERADGTRHIFFCLADHFEPFWNGARESEAVRRVEKWAMAYPKVVEGLQDNGGRPPQHSFFYPAEEYDADCVGMLAELQRSGYGAVEVHLHHHDDTSRGFREKVLAFTNVLNRDHGLLHTNPQTKQIEYAFIHGMFALDDSGPGGKWCGVKDEITILKETGCYADFTFPSAPDVTQPSMINRIYYAVDDPHASKSHNRGVDARFAHPSSGDLLLITGPLLIDWKRRKRGFIPAIENGALTENNPPTARRVDLWIRAGISVRGWPRWLFVKVHTHGTQEPISKSLLGGGLRLLYSHLLENYNDGRHFVTHFVRPREMYECVKSLEAADYSRISRFEGFDYSPTPKTGAHM